MIAVGRCSSNGPFRLPHPPQIVVVLPYIRVDELAGRLFELVVRSLAGGGQEEALVEHPAYLLAVGRVAVPHRVLGDRPQDVMHGLAIAQFGCEERLEPEHRAELVGEPARAVGRQLAERQRDGLVGVPVQGLFHRRQREREFGGVAGDFLVVGGGADAVAGDALVPG
jgi:hypothetical protein